MMLIKKTKKRGGEGVKEVKKKGENFWEKDL